MEMGKSLHNITKNENSNCPHYLCGEADIAVASVSGEGIWIEFEMFRGRDMFVEIYF